MKKTLVIVRHGNTFAPGQTPTRVGKKTDIPLVEELKSRNAAKYLLNKSIVPDRVFAAPLKRTMQTANLIINEMKLNTAIIPDNNFTEIDYGDDENQTEEQVRYRLGLKYVKSNNLSGVISETEIMEYGKTVIDLWNAKAIVPAGWNVDVDGIISSWKNFANNIIADNETALICSSNGIIRFAPHILNEANVEDFNEKYDLKVATGSVSIFKTVGNVWNCVEWNTKP
ncbi:MAG: histidine phosphatase family protein [Prevotellaceae bacterium]|jgi:probable phosphoglycerate mutase|nr:histidine phosphatase family protein [Prevotellaceae bacterium]